MNTTCDDDFLKYKERFDAFKAISTEFEGVLDWLQTNKDELQFDRVKRIISIGAGTGSFDTDFFKLFINLESYTVVEPNTFHIEEFKKNMGNNNAFIYHHGKIEDFTFNEEYDLALISHSLYYINDFCNVLQKISHHTKTGLIFHQTTFGINELQVQFGDSTTDQYRLSSDQIVEGLKQSGLPFRQWRIDASIHVADTQDIHIDFFLEKEASEDEKIQVRDYLRTKFPDGLMYHPVDAILFQQSKE